MTEAHVEDAARKRPLVYDKAADAHYDFTSAFIKSMRGSDPDAAVYYLAAMLESGEDARFIARRMIVLASEDIGNADPRALLVAVAAAQAVEHVGLPEARLNLAQAAIYLARAPKSNASYVAIERGDAPTCASTGHVAAAEGAPRRQLLRPQARPRRGLRLSARRPARLRGRLPAGRAARTHVLRAVRQRRRSRGFGHVVADVPLPGQVRGRPFGARHSGDGTVTASRSRAAHREVRRSSVPGTMVNADRQRGRLTRRRTPARLDAVHREDHAAERHRLERRAPPRP